MKILITGGNGYIAKSLQRALSKKYDIIALTRQDLDLTNSQLVYEWFKNKYFDVVIHCAVEGGSRLKKDTFETADRNLCMYYNLIQHRSQYTKFIHFGSGAELYSKETPYGMSKYIIKQSISERDEFYNLRIFAVFDENELDTRFIKTNIRRYINKESMQIYQDKYMDFIYMPDLIKIVDYYINNDNLPKEVNCSYNAIYSLTNISEIINSLDSYKVDIIVKNERGEDYRGDGISIPMNFIGLEKGIKEVYEKLKNEK